MEENNKMPNENIGTTIADGTQVEKRAIEEKKASSIGDKEKSDTLYTEEYKALRDAITRNINQINRLRLVSITATASLLGYAFANASHTSIYGPYVFLSPFAIMIPFNFLIAGLYDQISRVSMYIKVVWEPKFNFSWETYLFNARADVHKSRGKLLAESMFSMATNATGLGIGVVCFGSAFWCWTKLQGTSTSSQAFPYISVFIGALFFYSVIKIHSSYGFETHKKNNELWEKMKSK